MLLCFDKPPQIKPPEQCAPYELNMPDQNKTQFRAKHIKGADERIEIRTTQFGAETVIIVYKNRKISNDAYMAYGDHWDIRISANGKLHFTFDDWELLNQAVEEAREILKR